MPEEVQGLTYREAGVNIDAADEALKSIRDVVHKTFNERVLDELGSFGAMYDFSNMSVADPVLVSSVDGVGTKLKLAFMTGKHDTVGIDLVSHCVNDVLVQGARPLFFLDYLGFGVLDPRIVADVIRGVAAGCRYAGCALIGGETAEMPEMYTPGEYDLVGTIVGVVDRNKIIDGSTITAGDAIVGLKSSGLHTNGYSLARKVCFEVAGLKCDDPFPGTSRSVGDELLEPHRNYARIVQVLTRIVDIKGMAHVTGGGVTDNLPRILPDGLAAEVDLSAWQVPPVFEFIRKTGRVAQPEMLRTFNMGIGYIVVVDAGDAGRMLETLEQAGENAKLIGQVVPGSDGVRYKGSLRYGEPD